MADNYFNVSPGGSQQDLLLKLLGVDKDPLAAQRAQVAATDAANQQAILSGYGGYDPQQGSAPADANLIPAARMARAQMALAQQKALIPLALEQQKAQEAQGLYNMFSAQGGLAPGTSLRTPGGFEVRTAPPTQEVPQGLAPEIGKNIANLQKQVQGLETPGFQFGDIGRTLGIMPSREQAIANLQKQIAEAQAPLRQPYGPAAGRQAAGGMVKMQAPDGRTLTVPADKVAQLQALGAKIVQ